MDQFIRLIIRGISLSQIQSGIYVLLLEEEMSGKIKLPIIIESIQAQSIAFALGKKDQSRFFTHDLFFTFAKVFYINLKAVVIYKIINGIFFSYLLFEKNDYYKETKELKEHKISSKTSDAIALAVRFKAPIYTTKEIFNKAGVHFENGITIDIDKEDKYNNENNNIELENIDKLDIGVFFREKSQKDLENMTENDLNVLLNQAVINEFYELAAKIKKELDRRE
ncbi:bifunctional nuclease family protein [Blattabacterium cuenoti]|uniref:bifunctional nuclease family protein n=1 Tax=Blattabacterium cuenoti TaxID=1653831 RepID=UPI00163D0827|nr:bifunctional nuclease family protein [Blattabacterium cuenoti]